MRNNTVLPVEDNSSDELLALRAFKRNNIINEVVAAHDGEEALNVLFASTERPPIKLVAVALLAPSLPKVDGLEVLRQLRADDCTRFVPAVNLTAYREESDIMNV